MKSFYRFDLQPPENLPLTVRSVGEDEFLPSERIGHPEHKAFTQIFWTQYGTGEYHGSRQWIQTAGIFVLFPGELHALRPVTRWKYHWLTLDHPRSQLWVETMGVRTHPHPRRPCPVKLFRTLQREVRTGTVEANLRASHLVHAILLEASASLLDTADLHSFSWVEKCRSHIDANFSNPHLNVTDIARNLQMHRTTFFRSFLASQGMTPSHYLQNRRMRHAIELLRETELSIKEIAAKSGFTDPGYFARVLRRMSGLAPRAFRQAYRQGEALDTHMRRRVAKQKSSL